MYPVGTHTLDCTHIRSGGWRREVVVFVGGQSVLLVLLIVLLAIST